MSNLTSGNWVFDLDGVLIDTKRAVEEAYRYVGVEMPPDAWGKPWREWLIGPNAEDLHKKKNTMYYKTCGLYAKPMPLLQHVEKKRWPVITGASIIAVETLCMRFAKDLNVVLRGAALPDKIAWLSEHQPGTYVDDMDYVRQQVEEKTKWKAISPEECLRLFSQRGQIPDSMG